MSNPMQRLVVLSFFCAFALLLTACETAPETETEKRSLHTQVQGAIERFKDADPQIAELFNTAHAYAVFPRIGKGAVGVGGAYGHGEVYKNGRFIGYCDVSQGTVGLQLGGQSYSEVIFFKDAAALSRFQEGSFALAAQASAVAASEGSAAQADYEDGVMVFTMTVGGLMYEASVGGQNFTFEPADHPVD